MKKIVVVGSLNMDSVVETGHMPKPGETIAGRQVTLIPGGKGANQAYAIGKLGGCVSMIGAVGNDAFGKALKRSLNRVGVDTTFVFTMPGETTGQAFITVDDQGENSIIIIAGTNGKVNETLIQDCMQCISDSDIIVMQMEIPQKTIRFVKKLACSMGKTVILDPAPAIAGLEDEFWQGIDYLKPNETELEILTGRKIDSEKEMVEGARSLIDKGVRTVIITMGSKGCLCVTEDSVEKYPIHACQAVDTTAAGDSFTGAFALALSEGKDCREAIKFGQKVSAVVVTRKGAQTSIPSRNELEE